MRGLLTSAVLAALCLAAPSLAGAACEVPMAGDPEPDEGSCGPINPPKVFGSIGGGGGGGGAGAPRLILWTSGYDLDPLTASRSGIWIARIDGTQRRKLVAFERIHRDFEPHGLNLPDDHPSFSPDFRKIVFTSNRADRDNWDIYIMNVNGSGVTRLTSHVGLDTEPVVSPDGTKIAFATERYGELDIAVMNIDGSNVQQVTSNTQEDIEPAWRPDGQQLAFARVFSPGEKGVFTINPNGTGVDLVTNPSGEDHDPTYNPAGTQLVITTERPPFDPPFGNTHKIRISDGADLGDLTSDLRLAAGDPFWSKDGQSIAFFKSSTRFQRSPQLLYVMNSSGGGKFHIPGEAAVNIHPAMGVGIDDDGDGTPNYLESGSVGRSRVTPHRVRAGHTSIVHFLWKHPRRWRSLDNLWLRISSGRWLLGMVRFSVRDRGFSLFDGLHDRYTRARRAGRGRLSTPLFTLDLARTRFVGVNKKKLRLDLALRFRSRLKGTKFRIAGKRLRIRVQADTHGGRNQEEELGRLKVLRP